MSVLSKNTISSPTKSIGSVITDTESTAIDGNLDYRSETIKIGDSMITFDIGVPFSVPKINIPNPQIAAEKPIVQIPQFRAKNMDKLCFICRKSFCTSNLLTANTACGHVLHYTCLLRLCKDLDGQFQCPSCKMKGFELNLNFNHKFP